MVGSMGVAFRLPILPPTAGSLHGEPYILGGITGRDFLVSARGLHQPRANRGSVRPGVVITPLDREYPDQTIRYSTLSSTPEGWRGYTAKEASKGSSWVTEESSDCSVTESERFLPLSIFSSTLGLIILLQQSKQRNESNGNLGLCPLGRFFLTLR